MRCTNNVNQALNNLPRSKAVKLRIKKYRKSGKILDIGSSIGVFLEALNRGENYFQLTCCDIDKDSCDKLKNRYTKVDVINSDFVDIGKKKVYDIITMWDTVEHIVDQNLLFKSVKKMLKKDVRN